VITLLQNCSRIFLSIVVVAFLGQSLAASASHCITMNSDPAAISHTVHDHSGQTFEQRESQPSSLLKNST